jgi:hypothetical protein
MATQGINNKFNDFHFSSIKFIFFQKPRLEVPTPKSEASYILANRSLTKGA